MFESPRSAPAPRVTVITATYNRSEVLRYAIQSVVWQTFQDWEMLVVGDGCTDDSAAVVAAVGDARVRWHNLPQNSGNQATPNNAGLQMARGDFIAYLGHDDLWHPTHLATLVEALQTSGADVGYTLCENIGPVASGWRAMLGITLVGEFESDLIVPASAIMHTRAVPQDIGGWADYRTLRIGSDTEFIQRAYKRGKKFCAPRRLTVFKFSATLRKNVYRTRDADEQSAYIRRIQSEPDFLINELIAIATFYARRNPALIPRTSRWEKLAPRGARIEETRLFRGLAPQLTPKTVGPLMWLWHLAWRLLQPLRALRRWLIEQTSKR